MEPIYIVLEIQTNNGAATATPFTYADRNTAEAKFHEILMYAAVSAVPKHAAVLMNEEGFQLKSECYTHAEEE